MVYQKLLSDDKEKHSNKRTLTPIETIGVLKSYGKVVNFKIIERYYQFRCFTESKRRKKQLDEMDLRSLAYLITYFYCNFTNL